MQTTTLQPTSTISVDWHTALIRHMDCLVSKLDDISSTGSEADPIAFEATQRELECVRVAMGMWQESEVHAQHTLEVARAMALSLIADKLQRKFPGNKISSSMASNSPALLIC